MSLRVVVAEDDAEIRMLVTTLLQTRGYEVHEATNGNQALEVIYRIHPHAIILDRMMPQMDGDTVLQAVRNDPTLGATPIIMLTARATGRDINQSFEAGADDYITKPFHGDELERALAQLIGRP